MLGYGNFRGSGSSSGGFGGSRGGFRGGGSGFRPRRPFNGPREMTKIKCSECGKEDEVPFKPRDGTSVLCKECYFKKKGITPRSSAPAKESQEETDDIEFDDSAEGSEKPKKKKEDEFEDSEEEI